MCLSFGLAVLPYGSIAPNPISGRRRQRRMLPNPPSTAFVALNRNPPSGTLTPDTWNVERAESLWRDHGWNNPPRRPHDRLDSTVSTFPPFGVGMCVPFQLFERIEIWATKLRHGTFTCSVVGGRMKVLIHKKHFLLLSPYTPAIRIATCHSSQTYRSPSLNVKKNKSEP